MAIRSITQKASDNFYLHRDFHTALNFGLEYLREHYGDEAVEEYLRQFASAYYRPVKEDLMRRGLAAIREHYEKIYQTEGAEYQTAFEDGELVIRLNASPAVEHIRRSGSSPSPLYYKTVTAVNDEICSGTPYAFELVHYRDADGGYEIRFYKNDKR